MDLLYLKKEFSLTELEKLFGLCSNGVKKKKKTISLYFEFTMTCPKYTDIELSVYFGLLNAIFISLMDLLFTLLNLSHFLMEK